MDLFSPCGPGGPGGPGGPAGPTSPLAPWGPGGPASPCGPLPQAAKPASNATVHAKCDTPIVAFSQRKPLLYPFRRPNSVAWRKDRDRIAAGTLVAVEWFV
jgi:hypothetical protein